MDETAHPATARIGTELIDRLATGLAGADLTSVLLEVAKRRVARLGPSDVLRQRDRDRFVQPSAIDGRHQLMLEYAAVSALDPTFDVLTMAPLVPFGTHCAVARVSQNRVITTTRATEVAADPTNSLAIEGALRRRDLLRLDARSPEPVHLACVQRITRAQRFAGPMSFAHFSLMGLVIAGRDTGNRRFEAEALTRLLSAVAGVIDTLGVGGLSLWLTDFGGRMGDVVGATVDAIADQGIDIHVDRARTQGRGYYESVCFKIRAELDGEVIEIGDGGFVDWTQRLLSNTKERLLIGGISLDRIAIATDRVSPSP